MDDGFADNSLCSCGEGGPCPHCRFCQGYDSPAGRKALCEQIVHFLVFQPSYQKALEQAIVGLFRRRNIYYDEKHICELLFEALLYEGTGPGKTPRACFVDQAPLSPPEKRLYDAWRRQSRFGFFVIERVIPGREAHLTDLAGTHRYRVYEAKGTATMKEGSVIAARLVPFLDGWMMTTETVLTWSGDAAREQVKKQYGEHPSQWEFTRRYHADHQRRMAE